MVMMIISLLFYKKYYTESSVVMADHVDVGIPASISATCVE
jgi:hypothetical protein